MELDGWKQSVREWTDAGLKCVMDSIAETVPARLHEAMAYAVLSPGKRFRPLLVFLAADACRGEDFSEERILKLLPAAVAVEMIHAYSLVHDDLPAMDNDTLRRGKPTVWKQFDEATAILAGDALQTLAFETLAKIRPAEKGLKCVRYLSRAAGCHGMVGGQMDDLRLSDMPRPELPALLYGAMMESAQGLPETDAAVRSICSMQDRKTGAIITAAAMMGGELVGATEMQLYRLGMYAQHLGLMFQITDDLLDATSTAETMGKNVQKDDAHGKVTWVNRLGIEASRGWVVRLKEEAKRSIEGKTFAATDLLEELLDAVEGRKN
ncbi:MAG: polyprenyl synthetase family protein [Planctomycetia bacterium]|nr:polyprenyl synthetase family protein [Planctomycetia bacterium]